MSELLEQEAIDRWLRERVGWKREADALVRELRFESFAGAVAFVDRIAVLADAANHHPDIDIRYDRVRLALSSHDAGGITRRDLDLAQAIDSAIQR